MDATGITERPRELDAVRQRRAEMGETLRLLGAVLDSDGGDPRHWVEQLRAAVARLTADFALHVEVTEGPGGLHQAILAADLRLANPVAALSAEHRTIAADIASLHAAAAAEEPDVAALREQGAEVLHCTGRHRQRGADLIHEAYQTDIGGCD